MRDFRLGSSNVGDRRWDPRKLRLTFESMDTDTSVLDFEVRIQTPLMRVMSDHHCLPSVSPIPFHGRHNGQPMRLPSPVSGFT